MPGVGRAQGGGSGGARIGPGPKPKPGAKKRIRNKKAMAQAAASAAAAALVEKSSQPAVGRICGSSSFTAGPFAVTARAASERVSVAALAAKEKTAATEEKVAGEEDARDHAGLLQASATKGRARVSLLSAHT